MRHKPVLLKEILQNLKIPKGGFFIDCNLGDGGHTQAVIESLEGDVTVAGFDLDENAIERATKNIESSSVVKENKFNLKKNLHLFRKNFRNLEETIAGMGDENFPEGKKADAILFDLGISSYEIDESGRGFSFQKDEPLEMTFGKAGEDHVFTAYDIVNSWQEENIADIIYAYGEEKYSRRIAKAIVEARERIRKEHAYMTGDKNISAEEKVGIRTSSELAEIIKNAYPAFARFGRIHPATRTFQALRIAVNDELRSIHEALPQAVRLLKKGGRLAVISFHSLEDRIVKNFFKENSDSENLSATLKILTKKPIVPSEEEVAENPRSRSSKLRIAERI